MDKRRYSLMVLVRALIMSNDCNGIVCMAKLHKELSPELSLMYFISILIELKREARAYYYNTIDKAIEDLNIEIERQELESQLKDF